MTRRSIAFCWIPSHVGVQGNELTDAKAVNAVTGRLTNRWYLRLNILSEHLPATDFYTFTQGFLCWESCWVEDPRGAKLRNVQTKFPPRGDSNSFAIWHINITHAWFLHNEGGPPYPVLLSFMWSSYNRPHIRVRRFLNYPSKVFLDILIIPFLNLRTHISDFLSLSKLQSFCVSSWAELLL